jgi:MoxR-like ATPase
MSSDIRAINEKVKQESIFVEEVLAELNRVIVGQRYLLERMLVGLLGHGHLLLGRRARPGQNLVGSHPGLHHRSQFQRIQFTPDLLPADVVGTLIYLPKDGQFTVRKGPVFTNLLLADEINRAPPKFKAPCWRPCRNAR